MLGKVSGELLGRERLICRMVMIVCSLIDFLHHQRSRNSTRINNGGKDIESDDLLSTDVNVNTGCDCKLEIQNLGLPHWLPTDGA